MADIFDQIREQIHEIRNIVGPVDLKLANMEHQLNEKTVNLESKLIGALFRLEKLESKISDIVAGQEKLTVRVKWLEQRRKE
ncbi:MAG TPA: hypothetical protein VMH87_01970 [Pseudomonadales bacterium]|nr:hypothetical protein [Pseudomonadales bacterium]